MRKPAFLDVHRTLFSEAQAVSAYRYRQPYPEAVFALLQARLPTGCPRILDAGCGSGDLTVGLTRLGPVEAVDISAPMVAAGRARLGPQADVRWHVSTVEAAPLEGPFGLAVFGDSIHWLDWDPLFARLSELLHPRGWLALVARHYGEPSWWPAVAAIVDRYHTIPDYTPYDSVALLTPGYIDAVESVETAVEPFDQALDDFVEALHSRTGCTRDRMSLGDQTAFDDEIRAALRAACFDGPDGRPTLSLGTRATVTFARCR